MNTSSLALFPQSLPLAQKAMPVALAALLVSACAVKPSEPGSEAVLVTQEPAIEVVSQPEPAVEDTTDTRVETETVTAVEPAAEPAMAEPVVVEETPAPEPVQPQTLPEPPTEPPVIVEKPAAPSAPVVPVKPVPKPEPVVSAPAPVIEAPAPEAVKLDVGQAMAIPKVSLRASELPKNFSLWTLQRNWDGQHPKQCRLSTPTMQVIKGTYAFQVWLELHEDRLVVSSSANIDKGKKGVGVRFDEGALRPFTQTVFATQVALDGDLSTSFFTAKSLNVYLGGSEFGSKIQHTQVELSDMKQAIPALKACQAL